MPRLGGSPGSLACCSCGRGRPLTRVLAASFVAQAQAAPVREVVLDVDCSEAGASIHAESSRHGMLQGGLVAQHNAELRARALTHVLRVRRDVPFRHVRSLVALAVLMAALVLLGVLHS